METLIKIQGTQEGKKLIAYLRSLNFVEVMGDSASFIDTNELKKKVKRAEKSKSLTLEEAMQKSEAWKGKYK